jgi:hypothetical protein
MRILLGGRSISELPAELRRLKTRRTLLVTDRYFCTTDTFAAVLQIRRNAGRAEGVVAEAGFDAGRFRPPADDAVGVLLEEGIICKLAGLAAGGAEEIAVATSSVMPAASI